VVERIRPEDLRAHASWLRRLAGALVAESSEADDLVQETWLAALEQRPDARQPLRPWLGSVARNLWRMGRRASSRADQRLLALPDQERVAGADDLIARAEAQRELADVVLALAEPYRSTILLRYHEGLSSAAIADRSGTPAGTVRWRLKEGLERVRKQLDERHGGSDWRFSLLLLDRHHLTAKALKGVVAVSRTWKIAVFVSLLCGLFGAFEWRRAASHPSSVPQAPRAAFATLPTVELRQARDRVEATTAKLQSIELMVETPDGHAVPEAVVELFQQDPMSSPSAWTRTQTLRTNSTGRASIPAGAGSFLIAVHKDGFGAQSKSLMKPSFVSSTSLVLVLHPAEQLSGRVVSRRGEEVPLVRTTLTRWTSGSQRSAAPDGLAREVVADTHGRFAVDALEAGYYELEARADGFAPARKFVTAPSPSALQIVLGNCGQLEGTVVDETGKPAVADVRAIGSLGGSARSSATGAFTIELAPRAYHLIAVAADGRVAASKDPVMIRAGAVTHAPPLMLALPAALTGRVLASHDRVVPGAIVSATLNAGEAAMARTETSSNGAYLLDRLPPGRYLVRVATPGFNQIERQVSIAPSQRAALDFTLSAGGGIEGTVRDSKGAPLANARVVAGAHVGNAYDVAFTAETSTSTDGHFFLDGAAPGPTRIMALRASAFAGPTQLVDVAEEGMATADFMVAGDGIVEGRVSLEGGKLLPSPAVVRIKSDGHQVAEVPCGADGSYRVSLAAGDYEIGPWLLNSAPADGGGPVHVEAGATAHADFAIRDCDSVDTVQVVVTDLDGAPAAGATLMVQVQIGEQRVGMLKTADENGVLRFAPWSQIPVDRIEFTAVLDGRSGETTLDKPNLQAAIQLVPAATIHGNVNGAQPGAVLSVSISPSPDGEGALPLHTPPATFIGGSFTFDAVPAVAVIVSVTTPDGRSGQSRVSLQPGQTTDVQIDLASACGVTGHLVDANGAPLSGLVRVDSGNAISAGADGSFRVENLTTGPHAISAWLGDRYQQTSREFSLADGATLDLGNVVLKRATRSQPGP
jgi:RNA polymerase sigma factor (sigma-70 family)